MDIYLTEKELEREENLFAPNKQRYEPLKGKACDIREFVEQVSEIDNLPQPPSSC